MDPVAPDPPSISQGSDISNDEEMFEENNENSRDLDEERRTRLREIELKTMQYQDELESGLRSLKTGWTIQQQIEHYRRKLMKKTDKEFRPQDSDSPVDKYILRRDSKKSQSPIEQP